MGWAVSLAPILSTMAGRVAPVLLKFLEREVAKYVPLQRHSDFDDRVVILNDGSPFAMIEVTGQPFETSEDSEVIARFLRLNESWKQVATDGLIFYIWKTRTPLAASANVYPHHAFDHPVPQWIDDEYSKHLINESLYLNRKFIGLQLRDSHMVLGETVGQQISSLRKKRVEEEDHDRVSSLSRIANLLMEEFRDYKPRRLGVRSEKLSVAYAEFGSVDFSEIAEALLLASTGIWRKVPLTTGPLGEAAFREHVVFDGDTIKFIEPGAPWYGAILGWRHFPNSTFPGMFNKLLTADACLTVCHSFRCVPTEVAKGIMSRKRWKLQRTDDPAVEQQVALRQAAGAIGNADYVLGDYSFVCAVFNQNQENLGKCVDKVWGHIADGGVTTVREHVLSVEAAWASIFPGNAALRARPGYVHSRNFAAMAPLHSFNVGRRVGYWGKPAFVFRTRSGEPYYYHIHERDLGNTFFCGMSGSGKTTAVGAIIALSGRCGVRTNILYDKDRGLKVLIKSLGGSYLELGGPFLAPLKRLSNSPDDIAFLAELIRGAIKRDGKGELSPEDDRRLPLILDAVMQLPPEERWLEEVCAMLGMDQGHAGARLERWCWEKELGWVFDAPVDRVDFGNRFNAFDQTTILDHQYARGPTIAILHYYSTKLLDGRRLLETFEELNKSMSEAEFRPIINNSLRVIRKLGGATNLVTQSPHDIKTNEELGHVIREQIANMFFFANPRGQWVDYGPDGGFGCTMHEFEIIKNLPMGEGMVLLKGMRASQVLRAPLPEPVVALISGREEQTRLFDRIEQEEQNDTAAALQRWLKERNRQELE